MTTSSSLLRSLPVTVHGRPSTRMSDDELVRFESVLDAADCAVAAAMQTRVLPTLPSSESGTLEVLHALVETISAVTNSDAPSTLSKRAVIAWAHDAIVRKCDAEKQRVGAHEAVSSIDANVLSQSLELITRLNHLTSGAPTATGR